eukprot:6492538-Amphidinium_carterae.1
MEQVNVELDGSRSIAEVEKLFLNDLQRRILGVSGLTETTHILHEPTTWRQPSDSAQGRPHCSGLAVRLPTGTTQVTSERAELSTTHRRNSRRDNSRLDTTAH